MEQQSTGVSTAQAERIWETAYMYGTSRPSTVRMLRRQVMEFLNSSSFSREELDDVELAVGEACTNALRHGSPRGERDEIRVKCMKSEHTLVVEISDNGCGFHPNTLSSPSPHSLTENGVGILLMRTLMDSVEFEFGAGTTVRLVKRRRR